jgi:hypothetical protein
MGARFRLDQVAGKLGPKAAAQLADALYGKQPAGYTPTIPAGCPALPTPPKGGTGAVPANPAAITPRWPDLPPPEAEYRFFPERKWRFDFAWPWAKVALEVEGGVWTGGRHTRGSGFVRDIEKYNRAAVLGWRVVRCVPTDVNSAETVAMLRALLGWSGVSR